MEQRKAGGLGALQAGDFQTSQGREAAGGVIFHCWNLVPAGCIEFLQLPLGGAWSRALLSPPGPFPNTSVL